jgi:hypothetical protein
MAIFNYVVGLRDCGQDLSLTGDALKIVVACAPSCCRGEDDCKECDRFQYLIGVMTCALVNLEAITGRAEIKPSLIGAVSALVFLAIGGGIGFKILQSYYRSNGGDAGKFFVHRLMSISWVVSCRLSVVLLPLFILQQIIDKASGETPLSTTTLWINLGLLLPAIAWAVYYSISRTNRALREVSGIQIVP